MAQYDDKNVAGAVAGVTVGRSAIDGKGAFAAAPLAAGRKIGELTGERIGIREARRRARAAEAGRIAIVEVSDHHAIDATHSTGALRYVNHACAPNIYMRIAYGRVEFYTLRAIHAGEELTCNYGTTHHEGKLRCRCGADACRGWL